MDEADAEPARDQVRLGGGDGVEQRERAGVGGHPEQVRVVPGGGMVDETLDDVIAPMRSGELE